MNGSLTVRTAGRAVLTDLGRTRGPALGLPVGGAMDQYSARVANTLAGCSEGAALIEITAFDFSFTTDCDVLIAVTGARMDVYVDEVAQPMWSPVFVQAGQTVELENMVVGLHTYIAVHGSFEAPMLLGSCAPDTVAGFGEPLRTGSTLRLRLEAAPLPDIAAAALEAVDLDVDVPAFGANTIIDVADGPDIDEFAGTEQRLFHGPFRVSDRSNHIGVRMTGRLPVRKFSHEVLSRGVPVGAVEVPPGGELVVLHRGRGVTAGYPVLGVATPVALDALGQVRPGQDVRFRRCTLEKAAADARYWEERLTQLRLRVAEAYAQIGRPELNVGEHTPVSAGPTELWPPHE